MSVAVAIMRPAGSAQIAGPASVPMSSNHPTTVRISTSPTPTIIFVYETERVIETFESSV